MTSAQGDQARALTRYRALSERAGVVIEHPMDPGFAGRIETLKESIPKAKLEGLVANASELSPAAVLEMIAE